LISTLLITSANFVGWEDNIDKTLLERYENKPINEYLVILKVKANVSAATRIKGKEAKAEYVFNALKSVAENSQKNILNYLSANNIPHKSYYVTNAILVDSDIETLKYIAKLPEVESIKDNPWIKSLNYIEEKNQTQSVREGEPEWGIKMINADSLWRLGYTGQGVVIGGQDTGYDWKVSPLISKYRGISGTDTIHDYSWHDAISEISPLNGDTLITDMTNPCGLKSPYPCDDHNHGTHTMGTMVGQDEENSIGVAPDAKWIGCRNMERGSGKPSTYMECFEFFLAPTDLNDENPDVSKAPHVINNSWYCNEAEGCNIDNWGFMQEVIHNLKASGVVVVVSAGNDGPGCNTIKYPPALFEESFSIGATRSDDTIAGFSSRGLVLADSSFRIKPNVSAPGQNVRSVVRNGAFANYSGTSMAGPHVAGMVALLISARPQLAGEVDLIENLIEASAVPKILEQDCDGFLGSNIPNPIYGFGRVDVLAAYQDLLSKTDELFSNQEVFKIYPNPTTDIAKIVLLKSEFNNSPIKVINSNGIVVAEYKSYLLLQNGTLDLSNLPDGIYFISIKTTQSTFVKKVIKI
jgi:subtilisin family serine protease